MFGRVEIPCSPFCYYNTRIPPCVSCLPTTFFYYTFTGHYDHSFCISITHKKILTGENFSYLRIPHKPRANSQIHLYYWETNTGRKDALRAQ